MDPDRRLLSCKEKRNCAIAINTQYIHTMKFFTLKHSQSSLGKTSHQRKVGKDPATDWFLILCFFALLIVTTVSLTGYRFFKVNTFIKSLSNSVTASVDSGKKTKEEELQEVIKFYKAKQTTHDALLGRSKIDVKKKQQDASLASSTASTSSGAQSSGVQSNGAQKSSLSNPPIPASVQTQSQPKQSTAPTSAPAPSPAQRENLELVIPNEQ